MCFQMQVWFNQFLNIDVGLRLARNAKTAIRPLKFPELINLSVSVQKRGGTKSRDSVCFDRSPIN